MIQKLQIICAAAALAPALCAQGSLTPPGAPAPSMKTLGQIEPRVPIETLPFKIMREGSYYLATNLVVPDGTNGITIQAGNVSLDFSGFAITGSAQSREAVLVLPGLSHVSIRNGQIRGTTTGISAAAALRIKVDGLTVSESLGDGIVVGADSTIENCQASANEGTGIKAGLRSKLRNAQANDNFGAGFDLAQGCFIRDSVAHRNSGNGVFAGMNAQAANISAQENEANGIEVGNNGSVIDCTTGQNKGSGVKAAAHSLVSRTTASYNSAAGIIVGQSSSILDSVASANAWLGISADLSAQIANTKAEGNVAGGISAKEGSTIRDCTANRNGNDGILVTSECTVLRNTCNNNVNIRSAAGVHASGTDNVIQENNLVSNDRGLALDREGNFVTRNTASNNSLNFYIIGDQMMGLILSTLDDRDNPPNPASNFAF
jgi:parallel beta-helix repeat protein